MKTTPAYLLSCHFWRLHEAFERAFAAEFSEACVREMIALCAAQNVAMHYLTLERALPASREDKRGAYH